MKARTARVWLGVPPNDTGNARYSLWRTEVGGFMQTNDIRNKMQAGAAKWQMLKDYAIGHRLTRGYQQAYSGKDSVARDLQRALDVLLFDIRQKEALKRKRSDAEEAAFRVAVGPSQALILASSSQPAQNPSPPLPAMSVLAPGPALPPPQPTYRFSRGVLVSRIDPDELSEECATTPILDRPWEGNQVLCYMGMVNLNEGSIAHLISLALRRLPRTPARKVRDLLGALDDPTFNDQGKMIRRPKAVVLAEDEDVEGWLTETKATPLRLMVLLERLPPPGVMVAPQTPPPPGWSAHLDNQAFETVQEPTLESSDDEGPILRLKRRPATSEGYDQRLEKLRNRRARISRHIQDLMAQQKERFPSPSPDHTGSASGSASGSDSGSDNNAEESETEESEVEERTSGGDSDEDE